MKHNVTESRYAYAHLGRGVIVILKMLRFVLCYARSNATVLMLFAHLNLLIRALEAP